jgi:hypothetical protein
LLETKHNSQPTEVLKKHVRIHAQTPTTHTYLHSSVENILIRVDGAVVEHSSIQAHFLIVLVIPHYGGKTKVATNVVFDQLVRIDMFGCVLYTVQSFGQGWEPFGVNL